MGEKLVGIEASEVDTVEAISVEQRRDEGRAMDGGRDRGRRGEIEVTVADAPVAPPGERDVPGGIEPHSVRGESAVDEDRCLVGTEIVDQLVEQRGEILGRTPGVGAIGGDFEFASSETVVDNTTKAGGTRIEWALRDIEGMKISERRGK